VEVPTSTYPADITAAYITAYYDAFQGSGYVAGFYENPEPYQNFNSPYCAAVSDDAAIGSVPLWSSEPEKDSYTPYASQAPAWTGSAFPGTPSCANTTVAWQYLENGVNTWPGDAPNVDVDEFDPLYQTLLWGFGAAAPGSEVTVDSAGEADVVLTGENGEVYSDPCCWQGWQGLPASPVAMQPGAVVAENGDGQMQVFAVGTDQQMYDTWQETAGGTWSSWQALGGVWPGQLAVGTEADGSLDVFAVGSDGQLFHQSQTGAVGSLTSSWTSLGGSVMGTPAVGQDADGRLEVFVVSSENGPLEDFWESSGGTWTESSLGGSWSSSATPSVVGNLDGRLQVFITTNGWQLYDAWQVVAGGGWSTWQALGGTWANAVKGISAILNQDGEIQLFARGDDGYLYNAWQQGPGGGFTGWTSLGAPSGGITGGPFTVIWPDGHLEVFVFGADSQGNALWHTWQTCASGCGWSGFADLGGAWVPPAA
jgi:hypothetical protein